MGGGGGEGGIVEARSVIHCEEQQHTHTLFTKHTVVTCTYNSGELSNLKVSIINKYQVQTNSNKPLPVQYLLHPSFSENSL